MKSTSISNLIKKINQLPVSQFTKNCYLLIIHVPKGKVITYRSIAEALGSKAYRAVGSAMRKNPLAPIVPCHRVINSSGQIGEYAFGKAKKIKLLTSEGIKIQDGKVINLAKHQFKISSIKNTN